MMQKVINKMSTAQIRCNVCDSVLQVHWNEDSDGVFAYVDQCPQCAKHSLHFEELLKQWANEQGFDGWSQDHAAVLRNLAKWINGHAVVCCGCGDIVKPNEIVCKVCKQ